MTPKGATIPHRGAGERFIHYEDSQNFWRQDSLEHVLLPPKVCQWLLVQGRLTQCTEAHKDLDTCLSQLMEDIRPLLAKGIPELNVPILEPINLQNLTFVQREGAVNIRARFRDVLVGGFSNFTLDHISTDLDSLELRVRVFIPVLRVSGNYILDGNIILLPVTGDGPFRATLHDITAAIKSQIVVKKDKGKERLGIANTKINFQLRNARARLRNLFNGDPILGETVNHFINTNDQMILREVKPAVSQGISQLVQTVMDSALGSLPLHLVKSGSTAQAHSRLL